MSKDEFQFLQKRFLELSRQAAQRNQVVYSDFLNLNELHILHSIPKHEFYTSYQVFGGYEMSERQMVAFLPDALCFEISYPISVLKVEPLVKKFARELSHRDYLGALIHLGIERKKIGDILVDAPQAYLFVETSILPFLNSHLEMVGRERVQLSRLDSDLHLPKPKFQKITGSVSSLRLDCILSLGFQLSRSKAVSLIESGRVFVNGRLITSNGYSIKEGDKISVRKLGRIIYDEILSNTKKGRYLIQIRKF